MGRLDVTLFAVSAILVVDQLTASASIGTGAIGWWIIALLVFLVPYGLITAELATTYPEQGGIYVWTKRAFGRRWAARNTYWYWVNVALWMPSVFLLFAGLFCQLFVSDWTNWPDGKWPQVAIAVALSWAVVAVGIVRLDLGKWVNNVGAALKMVIIFAIGAGGIVFAIRHGSANSISAGNLLPSFGVTKTYLPVIIYLLMGFELVANLSGEVKRPEKDIPRALFTSGLAIGALYVFSTVGILLALSLTKLELVQGLVETFRAIFGSSGLGEVAVYVLGIGVLYTYFTNMTTWTMGANRAAVEAAADGELPKVLGREHPQWRTPVAALVLTGIVSTAVLVVSAIFIDTQDNLFFAIFAASAVVFLLPYLLMFPAVVVLRRKDPDRPRPFRMPGGEVGAWAYAIVTTLIVAASMVLFVWPEIPNAPEEWSYTGPLLGIVVAALVVGEAIIWRMAHPGKPKAAKRPPERRPIPAQPATGGH
ncbi:MAG TPA: APC family permease [Solirubrobacterales bacterium]